MRTVRPAGRSRVAGPVTNKGLNTGANGPTVATPDTFTFDNVPVRVNGRPGDASRSGLRSRIVPKPVAGSNVRSSVGGLLVNWIVPTGCDEASVVKDKSAVGGKSSRVSWNATRMSPVGLPARRVAERMRRNGTGVAAAATGLNRAETMFVFSKSLMTPVKSNGWPGAANWSGLTRIVVPVFRLELNVWPGFRARGRSVPRVASVKATRVTPLTRKPMFSRS